jgi:UDPglucose 6-dehydrogenase
MIGISIIGSGWVGTSIGKGFSKLGYNVIFYDIIDRDLPNFTRDMNYAIENSDFSFICVPTPTIRKRIDLSYIKEVSKNIGKALRLKNKYHVLVIKSTVLPGTTEKIIIPIVEKYANKKVGNFGVCVSPEFFTMSENSWSNELSMRKSFFSEDRVVIGEVDKESGNALEKLYKPLSVSIFRTNLKTAEMIKYASNCMLATKISYWNEIFLICEKVGIDSEFVANIVGLDSRIGKYGTVHGKAFGGRCLPKDLKAFIHFAEKYHEPILLKAVEHINEIMKKKYGVRE